MYSYTRGPVRTIALIAACGAVLGCIAALTYHLITLEREAPALSAPYVNPSPYPQLVYYRDYLNGPAVTAGAAVLVEATTGTILYAKNEHEKREPASITKVMTAIVALERGDLSDTVVVSKSASRVPGSSLRLAAGDEYKLEELIRATMLRSGNDGATAIAEHIGGSTESFVEMMNARARTMGLRNTSWANPHGLSAPGHYTTAYDIALMCMFGFRLQKFADIVGCPELWSAPLEGDGSRLVYNTNKLLWSLAGADGVKTGTTSQAGHCLAASATRDGLRLIAVVLKSNARFRDASALLEYGFANFTRLAVASRGEPVADAAVSGGVGRWARIGPANDVELVMRTGDLDHLSWSVATDGLQSDQLQSADGRVKSALPRAPVAVGQRLGSLVVRFDGAQIDAYPLYALEEVRRRPWWAWWRGGPLPLGSRGR